MGQAKRRGTLEQRKANAKGSDYKRHQNFTFNREADHHLIRCMELGEIKALQDGVGQITAEDYKRLIAEDFQRDDISFMNSRQLN
jgi:hypothetical protein